jgi:hypothetical protein
MRRYCVKGCGGETGKYAGTGRRNPYFCPMCDEVRINHVSEQLKAIMAQFPEPPSTPAPAPTPASPAT